VEVIDVVRHITQYAMTGAPGFSSPMIPPDFRLIPR
jgi:hypothetical protein